MDELLAGLQTDAPVFDAPSMLGSSFEMENGFMTDPHDQSLYPPDISAQLRTGQQAQSSADIDYLNLEEQDMTKMMSNPDGDTPTTAAAKAQATGEMVDDAEDVDFAGLLDATTSAKPTDGNDTVDDISNQPGVTVTPPPTSPADAARLRLRPVALTLVADAWRLSSTPAAFIRAVRERFIRPDTIADDSATPAMPSTDVSDTPPQQPVPWQLSPAAEGAILDALLIKVVHSEAASPRLLRYLRYALVTGIVSQRATIAACLRWVNATSSVSERVLHALARLMADLLPHYRFHIAEDVDVRPEVKDFLFAFTVVTKEAAKAPAQLAAVFANVLSHDRVVALVRACARRVPAAWPPLDAALADLDTPPTSSFPHAPSPCSAMVEAPRLVELVPRLRRGLCVGATNIASIVSSIDNLRAISAEPSLHVLLQTAFGVTIHVFGRDVANGLKELYTKKEDNGTDFLSLKTLEQTVKTPQQLVQHDPVEYAQSSRFSFKTKLQASEAVIRFFAERAAASPEICQQWKKMWGGKERLQRIIRDAIPQVKSEIRSETGALVVAMAVTCCACLCLGSALRVDDANSGVDVLNSVEASLQESQHEEVEETMGELIGFSVGSLEEAAKAEEIPSWRSFGLWLLFLMSRAGSILRASGCEHARAAKVLRAWGGQPTGTPGSHVAQSSHGHKHTSGQSSSQQTQSSSSWAMNEGVTTFAGYACLAIIDVSDVSGSDETLQALCQDLVQ